MFLILGLNIEEASKHLFILAVDLKWYLLHHTAVIFL